MWFVICVWFGCMYMYVGWLAYGAKVFFLLLIAVKIFENPTFYNLVAGSVYNLLCSNLPAYSALTTLASLLFLNTSSTHYLRTLAGNQVRLQTFILQLFCNFSFLYLLGDSPPLLLCHLQRPKGWFKKIRL